MNYRNRIPYVASVTVIILETGLRSIDKINDKRCDALFDKFQWNTINLRFLSPIPRDYLSAGLDFFVSKSLLLANSFLANLTFDFSH